ncbi:MAG: M13 family metallopeptidase [Proteobacteria bacterium]|nr:M13 family metallopeptidase [Pseudomonadota bacterium]
MTVILAACGQQGDESTDTATTAGIPVSGIDTGGFDTSVRPQDDFFRYVNGGWIDRTDIPADKSNYGSFNQLADKAEADLRAIIEEAAAGEAAAGTDTQKVGDFYATFIDQAQADALGAKPLEPFLAEIAAIETHDDVLEQLARMQRNGSTIPVGGYVGADAKNSTQYALVLWQSGLGMPDRDYYLSDDEKFVTLRGAYVDHVAAMLAKVGHEDPRGAAERILALETKLAENQWTRVENRDDNKTYNKIAVADLNSKIPGFDWARFLDQSGAGSAEAVIVSQPSYFEALAGMFSEVPVATWKDYMQFHTTSNFAPLLSAEFVDENFAFYGKALRGIQENRPRWKRGVAAVEGALGEVVGKLYVERHFSPEAKARMVELVDNLLETFDASIDELDWMGPETKKAAHEKLSKFTVKIGYPDKWKDYSGLDVVEGDLVGNVVRSRALEYQRELDKLGKPVDKSEWFMTPQTVNAYYNPTTNEIAFPAAILQPPFFNMAADDAVNYGGIGAVIGHEISHGFDDSGADYDGDGNLRNWFTEQDLAEFNTRGKALSAQYSQYSPIEGMFVNGDLTLGENIGDLSGLAIAHRAYRRSLNGGQAPVIGGFTGDQRFFLGWAQVWRTKYRDQALRQQLLTDSHSPGVYRTNGVLVNLPAFYDAFNVKPGDRMYLPPEKRVRIW